MKLVKRSEIKGTIPAPPSKSVMLRATAAALLSNEVSLIRNPSYCQDSLAGLSIAESLGAEISKAGQLLRIKGSGALKNKSINCQESGLCMRMFTPIAALYKEEIVLNGEGSLCLRPMGMMEKPLQTLGAFCRTQAGFAPVRVKGPLKGGLIRLDSSLSSQFLSGLLMALPLCAEDSRIMVSNLKSKPYVALTLSILKRFKVSVQEEKDFQFFEIKGSQNFRGTELCVEGDWSAASFLLVAAALCGRVQVTHLQMDSLQADKRILEALEIAGAKIEIKSDSILVEKNCLKAFDFDATDCPDLFPSLAVLACACHGRSRLAGVKRLKHKESDRGQTLLSELTKIGARIAICGNWMEIEGSQIKGGLIRSHHDHRIAMAAACAGLISEEGVSIEDWECVSKSYPHFFSDLESIGGRII